MAAIAPVDGPAGHQENIRHGPQLSGGRQDFPYHYLRIAILTRAAHDAQHLHRVPPAITGVAGRLYENFINILAKLNHF
jgi:hypothetical protein